LSDGAGTASYLASFLRSTHRPEIIAWKRQLIRRLGVEIGRRHSAKIIHGDLRPNNFLIELGKVQPGFYFIDNERTKQYRQSPPRRLIIKNLVQIGMLFPVDISKTNRLRFWNSYCAHCPRYTGDRAFMNAIFQRTMDRLINTSHYQPRQPDLPTEYLSDGKILPKA
jgi:serine/threonine protein kinase